MLYRAQNYLKISYRQKNCLCFFIQKKQFFEITNGIGIMISRCHLYYQYVISLFIEHGIANFATYGSIHGGDSGKIYDVAHLCFNRNKVYRLIQPYLNWAYHLS